MGRGRGGRVPPDTSHWEIFADLPGKREARENGEKKKENLKMEGGKLKKGRRKHHNLRRGLFFFLMKFVLSLPKCEFSTGKKHSTPGKKIRKNDFAPSEKYSSYAPEDRPLSGQEVAWTGAGVPVCKLPRFIENQDWLPKEFYGGRWWWGEWMGFWYILMSKLNSSQRSCSEEKPYCIKAKATMSGLWLIILYIIASELKRSARSLCDRTRLQ